MPRNWHLYSVDAQDEDSGSMLNYYRDQIRMRKSHEWMGLGQVSQLSSDDGLLSFVKSRGQDKVMVALNFNGIRVILRVGKL